MQIEEYRCNVEKHRNERDHTLKTFSLYLLPGLKNLDSLGLAHNQLREVPARVFAHLTQLNSLELDGNQITHVDPDAFIGLEGKRNHDFIRFL